MNNNEYYKTHTHTRSTNIVKEIFSKHEAGKQVNYNKYYEFCSWCVYVLMPVQEFGLTITATTTITIIRTTSIPIMAKLNSNSSGNNNNSSNNNTVQREREREERVHNKKKKKNVVRRLMQKFHILFSVNWVRFVALLHPFK